MTIGDKILELRRKRNLSQERLSERIGVTRQTLSNWESNITSPDLSQANKLCQELKIAINELLDENLDFYVKENSLDLFSDLIGKTVILDFNESDNQDFNGETYEVGKGKPINLKLSINKEKIYYKILAINDDFVKVEYIKNGKSRRKLIDLELVLSIAVVKEEDL